MTVLYLPLPELSNSRAPFVLVPFGVRGEGETVENEEKESSLCKSMGSGVGEMGTLQSKVTSFTGAGSI